MDAARLKRVRHRAWRRGFREADLILGPFADSRVRDFSAAELECFERLLEEDDHDIYAWVMKSAPAPLRIDRAMMAALQAFCRQ